MVSSSSTMLPAINCSETYIALIKFVATEKGGRGISLSLYLQDRHARALLRHVMIAIKHTCIPSER